LARGREAVTRREFVVFAKRIVEEENLRRLSRKNARTQTSLAYFLKRKDATDPPSALKKKKSKANKVIIIIQIHNDNKEK
jgi:hypothetical protein